MSVTKLNKISGLAPENETPEEHQGPPKDLNEIIKVTVRSPSLKSPRTQAMHGLLTIQ